MIQLVELLFYERLTPRNNRRKIQWSRLKKYVKEVKGDWICQIFTWGWLEHSIADQSGFPNRNEDHAFLPILLTLANLIEAFETDLSRASILAWRSQATPV